MSTAPSLVILLGDLNASLKSTLEATEKINNIETPQSGLSLLNTKNELLLSYIQNIVFLVLLKIRNAKKRPSKSPKETVLFDSVVEKLVELRLYLEKGVRPLEEKLRFQIEKALRSADDAERTANAATSMEDSTSGSGSDSSGNSDDDGSGDENLARSRANARPALSNMKMVRSATAMSRKSDTANAGGVDTSSLPYRPPKNRPVVMPSEREERAERRVKSSRTLDEYVDSELLPTPMEMPSIGSAIVGRGRSTRTSTQRREEDERRDFEESHFVRLPKLSKKEQARKNKIDARRSHENFGGEEWRDLDQGLRRIDTLTQRTGPSGSKAALDKSRKRVRETTDGPRQSGSAPLEMGERFSKKLKVMERGRGKKRR